MRSINVLSGSFLPQFAISAAYVATLSMTLVLACAPANADRLVPDTVTQVQTGNRAVNTLIMRARQFLKNGAHDSAATELERAIRIAPRTALAWHELARVRFVQGNHRDAESLATKAAVLIDGSNIDLNHANERIRQLSQRAQGKYLTGTDSSHQRVVAPQPQPTYKVQTLRIATPKEDQPEAMAADNTRQKTTHQTRAQTSVPVQVTSQQGAAQSATTQQIVQGDSQPVTTQSPRPQPVTTASVQPVQPIPQPAFRPSDATPEEVALSPARPIGQHKTTATRSHNTQSRLAHRAPPPVSRTQPQNRSGPAKVVERSAPLVPAQQLIKRRPDKTRMTILLFQAKRGAPVVEKSLVYQPRHPSPVAVN